MSTARATGPLHFHRRDPRGQVLVLFALVLIVLLLVSALAIDYGGFLVTKRTYQNASDSASLAGAQFLTRPASAAKQSHAKQAAWASVASALGFAPAFDPVARAAADPTVAYVENGYSVWVASPPSEANVADCDKPNHPPCTYRGHASSSGVVFVRIDHEANTYMSRIAGIGRTVSAWSTAGRFPRDFAVIALCDPFDVSTNCDARNANITLDGDGTNLIVESGDVGTNRWVKANGKDSGIALSPDSNAYMGLYDECWSTNQCKLFTWDGTLNTAATRSALPLGAPTQDPGYLPPTINSTTTPRMCTPAGGSVTLASSQILESAPDPGADMQLAAVVRPLPAASLTNAVATNNDLQGFVKAATGGAALNGMNISATNGTNTYTGATSGGGPNAGRYGPNGNFADIQSGTYDITATDPNGVYHQTTVTGAAVIPTSGSATVTATQINMQKNPVISGTVTSGGSPVGTASITITGPGGPFTTTTAANGSYSVVITTFGTFGAYDVTASKSGYVDTTVNSGLLSLDVITTVNISMAAAPASLTGTITDVSMSPVRPVPGVTVTLSSGESATTNASGVYTIASTASGTKTITLSGTAMVGYAYAAPASGFSRSVSGSANQDFALWPKGCKDTGGARGDWDCTYPSNTNNCPGTTGGDYPTCVFTQANAIKPGTYRNITIDGCAWIDPKGGATGNAADQLTGIIYITDTLLLKNNSYIFGDGVTIVMGTGAKIENRNGSGFVLNYGTTSTAYTIAHAIADTSVPCFRTTGCTSLDQDYAYAAWTTAGAGHSPWGGSGTGTTYDNSLGAGYVAKGTDLGITWFLYGTGSNTYTSRFKIAGNSFGFLFNGVLYGPRDEIEIGGGGIGQSAAGQIVGWTIEYHGATQIRQNWYAYPTDGEPFLIEPVLGE